MVVALFPVPGDDPVLESAGLKELAELGVTHAAFFRDASVAGLVLEGWAFDARDVDRAARAVAGASDGIRTLRPLVQMSISAAGTHGGPNNVRGGSQ
jgi:hypothetical protein